MTIAIVAAAAAATTRGAARIKNVEGAVRMAIEVVTAVTRGGLATVDEQGLNHLV